MVQKQAGEFVPDYLVALTLLFFVCIVLQKTIKITPLSKQMEASYILLVLLCHLSVSKGRKQSSRVM